MFDKFSIREMKIQGMKSVINGEVKFNKNDYSGGSLLGVYGQNGSGKTSLIDALNVVISIVNNNLNIKTLKDIISKKTGELKINIIFEAMRENEILEYHYFLCFKIIEDEVKLIKEMIKFKGKEVKILKEIASFEYLNKDERILPKVTFEKLMSYKTESYEEVIINGKDSFDCKSSFFLNQKLLDIICKEDIGEDIYYKIFDLLINIRQNIFVIGTPELGASQVGMYIPITIHKDSQIFEEKLKAIVPINLQGRTILDEDKFPIVSREITKISKSLNKIIPGVELEISEYAKRLDNRGRSVVEFDVFAKRGDIKIPLMFESEGIKKIISIMGAVKAVYNNPNVIVFIDELDSGIFEYLIGEIVEQLDGYSKGQMLFTSHNFRILEVLSHKNIYFSTTDENNRFVKMKNIGTNNNLRKKYYEAIQLGTDDIELYEPTEPFEIREGLGE